MEVIFPDNNEGREDSNFVNKRLGRVDSRRRRRREKLEGGICNPEWSEWHKKKWRKVSH